MGSLDFRPFFSQRNCQNTDLNHQNIVLGTPKMPDKTPRNGHKFSTGPQLSEYVQVVCRNTNGTCLKSVSKTPTFKFFSDFQLLQHPAKLAKYRPNLGQFWPKRAIFQISNQSRNIFWTAEARLPAKN